MATLTGNTIASTYTGLLSVTGAVGADTVEAVTDGAGTSTSLSLSQQRATITLGSGAADDFIVDGTTFVVEGDNNRVGIGTASPARTLDVVGDIQASSLIKSSVSSNSTNLATANGGTLILENSHNTDGNFSNIGGYNTNGLVTSQINLVNVSQSSRHGAITLNTHNGTSLTERVRVDKDGSVGIGTSAPEAQLHIWAGDQQVSRGVFLDNNRTQDNSETIRFRKKSGSGVPASGHTIGTIEFAQWDGDEYHNGAKIHSICTGSVSNNQPKGNLIFSTIDGSDPNPIERVRIKGNGGITFNGDTADANALDDYEEGAITPTLLGAGSNPTQVYQQRGGFYTKIGNRVFYTIRIQMNSSGVSAGSGDLQIGGLPFTVRDDVNTHGAVSVGIVTGFNTGQHGAPTQGYHSADNAVIGLEVYDNDGGNTGGISEADAADVTTNTTITVSGHYIV